MPFYVLLSFDSLLFLFFVHLFQCVLLLSEVSPLERNHNYRLWNQFRMVCRLLSQYWYWLVSKSSPLQYFKRLYSVLLLPDKSNTLRYCRFQKSICSSFSEIFAKKIYKNPRNHGKKILRQRSSLLLLLLSVSSYHSNNSCTVCFHHSFSK